MLQTFRYFSLIQKHFSRTHMPHTVTKISELHHIWRFSSCFLKSVHVRRRFLRIRFRSEAVRTIAVRGATCMVIENERKSKQKWVCYVYFILRINSTRHIHLRTCKNSLPNDKLDNIYTISPHLGLYKGIYVLKSARNSFLLSRFMY